MSLDEQKPFDNDTEYHTELQKKEEIPKDKKKGRAFLSSISAGVLGSAITLGFVTFTDSFANDENVENQPKTEEVTTTPTGSSNVNATPVSTQTGSLADIVEEASQAIVGIVNIQQQRQFYSNTTQNVQSGTGSGILFKKEEDHAYVVTNYHVIEGAYDVEVSLYNGEKASAKLVGADPLTDLAVLKIDAEHVDSVIDFGDSSNLRPGDQVLAIGNPLGLDLSRTVTQGIVSAVNRSIPVSTSAGEWELNVIQTDAAINPGNSGGALINTKGEVIGINSLKIAQNGVEGLGFAIPSNDLVPIVNEIIQNGEVERPYMGVGLVSLDEVPHFYLPELPESVEGGAVVQNLDPNSAAAKAGIKVKDVIVSINGVEVKSSNEIRKYLYTELKVGDEVKLGIYRDGKPITISMTLTSKDSGI
ncbi:serine protease HtrA [Bacillus carboniphilus]|uniref:Serine protease HtrA n=1 Tax=Bacillus carboniphilus TaxID=86663 RepID=A0ABN0WTP7_9BACI